MLFILALIDNSKKYKCLSVYFFKIMFLKIIINRLIELIFPQTCLVCNQIIDNGNFCVKDWSELHFLQKPACNICFQPFEFKIDDKAVCGKCLQKRPKYFKAISVWVYNEQSRIIISRFKYYDQTNLAKYFSEIMFKQAQEILPEIDFIVPIPLHKFRINKRKYNQAAILAKNIAKLSDKELILDLLVRTKNNQPQASLKQRMRYKNVKGIFKTKEKYLTKIKGKNVLLIDDVITTGATVESCAKELKSVKVNRIYVLTLAKTITNA